MGGEGKSKSPTLKRVGAAGDKEDPRIGRKASTELRNDYRGKASEKNKRVVSAELKKNPPGGSLEGRNSFGEKRWHDFKEITWK